MKQSILAGRMQNAIDSISEAFGIEWPKKIKGKTTDHRRLVRLERLAREAHSGNLMTAEQFIKRIAEIDGIGDATVKKISDGLLVTESES